MNRFIIALILGMLLASTFAFKLRTHSKLSVRNFDGDEDDHEGDGSEGDWVAGAYTPVLSRGDRPMGHQEESEESYNGDCNPENQEGLDDYNCPNEDQDFVDSWKGVLYCGRMNEFDNTTPQRIWDQQLNNLRDQDVGATLDFGCVASTTLWVTGYHDCDIYRTLADALEQEDERMGGDMTEQEVLDLAAESVRCVLPSFTHWWCPAYTPEGDNLGQVEPNEDEDDQDDQDDQDDEDDQDDQDDQDDEDDQNDEDDDEDNDDGEGESA